MRSIAVVNQKGGVGKTTTAVNLSAALARSGRRVLLVDLDPQAHATMHLGVELDRQQPSIYDVLVHRRPAAEAARTVEGNLTLIPAHVDLVGAEIELADQLRRETRLASVLGPYLTEFEFCIIDCAPSLGLLAVNALAAVGEVIIPLQPHFLALQGLGRLLETVSLVRARLNPALRVSGVLLCLYEAGTRLAQEVREDVVRFLECAGPDAAWYGARVFATTIRRNIRLAECPSFGQTIFAYAPASHGARDYQALAAEVVAMATDGDAAGGGSPATILAGAVAEPAGRLDNSKAQ